MSLRQTIRKVLREEINEVRGVYYGFVKLPNYWVNDNDFTYNDEFFNDKDYEDYYFDNFKEMDRMFGHRKSLFGTRGLDVGDENRTSRSFNYYNELYGPAIVRVVKDKKESINEVRVPRDERVELYKDDNIIVVVPLTHRALQKYAHQCQWCINDDKSEWEDYHQGKHAVIIQRNPKKSNKGITGMETYGEIFVLSRLDNGMWDWKSATDILGYDFGGSKEKALDYYVNISNDINNFATNIVYYSPETGIYDQEDNFLWNFNFEISDIPNVTPEVIEIMDDYLQESEEMNLQESIRKILREETKLNKVIRRRVLYDDLEREFEESLDSSSKMLHNLNKNGGGVMSLNRFIDVTMSILMDGIHYFLMSTMPEDYQWYDQIFENLRDYFKDRVEDRYLELISNI